MDESNNTHLSKKERRQLRREEKENQRHELSTKNRTKKAIFYGIGIVVVIGVGWGAWKFLFSPSAVNNNPIGQDFSREMPDEGRNHVTEGDSVKYKTNPPTSGPHWPDPVIDGVYDRSQPDEGMIHSLEHGRVWISYKPSIPDSAKETLRKIAKSQVRVILTERQANDTDIAVAGWRRLDTFNLNQDGSVDENRIRDFIIKYRDKGPEYVPVMTGKVY